MKVSEEVKQKYDDIKKKKCHRYMVLFIKDEKTIAVEKIGKFFDAHQCFITLEDLSKQEKIHIELL